MKSKYITFLNKAETKIQQYSVWVPSDPLIAASMLFPALIKKSAVLNLTPIMQGEARGGTQVDYMELTGKPKNVEIIKKINVDNFKKYLRYSLTKITK